MMQRLLSPVTRIISGQLKQTPRFFINEKKWNERTQAQESVFINSEDQKAIKKLLNKLEAQSAIGSGKYEEFHSKDITEIKEILERYKIKTNEAVLEELVEWKYK